MVVFQKLELGGLGSTAFKPMCKTWGPSSDCVTVQVSTAYALKLAVDVLLLVLLLTLKLPHTAMWPLKISPVEG